MFRHYNHQKGEINKKKNWFSRSYRVSLNEEKMKFDKCIKRADTSISSRYDFWIQRDNGVIVMEKE
jgi:hypothetical protein